MSLCSRLVCSKSHLFCHILCSLCFLHRKNLSYYAMDYIKSFAGSDNQNQSNVEKPPQTQNEGGGGLMGRLNNAMGGGQAGEAKEGVSCSLEQGSSFRSTHDRLLYVACPFPQDTQAGPRTWRVRLKVK